jgi:hypothetical protein
VELRRQQKLSDNPLSLRSNGSLKKQKDFGFLDKTIEEEE